MPRNNSRNYRRALKTKKRAFESQNHLEKILISPWEHSPVVVDSAARDMLRISRRHRLGLPKGRRAWICRGCKVALRPGINSRVRVRNKNQYVTCLSCGVSNVRGPDYGGD